MGNLLPLFIAFLKVGVIGFGGGNNLIPLVESQVVPRWISAEEFAQLVGINFAFPGLSAIKLAGVIGMKASGLAGLVVCVAALTLPGVVAMVVTYSFIVEHREHWLLQRLLTAMKYATPALLAVTAVAMFQGALGERPQVSGIVLSVGLFAAMYWLHLSPLLAVVLAGALGILLF